MTDPKVDEFISKQEPNEQEFVSYLRNSVLKIDPEIQEQIKWNSPSFFYAGEMKAFDSKEYKRDLLVLNLHHGKFLLVFPTGAKIEDSILKGKNYPDGRKIVTIENLEGLKKIEPSLKAGILDWIKQIEK
ncbi:MAG: hypothetical protein K0S23_3274 [Fluviicola sp.]|jgi:hypothetical protein|uniref:DUF1801 domain-containing protein n=1 Tax=Fluviicola sp. TaxID=1917219 RepID=UPI00262C5135|nr:DUF1801 domain-containing protein [Fluviicola sp.]MDF3028967.1 hypothetical protein [Fluviicola sp.]